MKYSIPAILSWDPFSVLGRCLQAINWSEVMDKRFLSLLKKKKKNCLNLLMNAVIFLWKRKAKLGSEQEL